MKYVYETIGDMQTISIPNIGSTTDSYPNAWITFTSNAHANEIMEIMIDYMVTDNTVRVYEILDIYVPESMRDRGIGRKLINKAKKEIGKLKNTIIIASAGYTDHEFECEPDDSIKKVYFDILDKLFTDCKFSKFSLLTDSIDSRGYIFNKGKKMTTLVCNFSSEFNFLYRERHPLYNNKLN